MQRFCPSQRIAVHVEVTQHDVMRNLVDGVLRAGAVADLDDVAVAVLVRRELEISQLPVMGAGGGPQAPRTCSASAGARAATRAAAGCAGRSSGQISVNGRPDSDRGVARLHRKNEVADELGAGLEHQNVAGHRAIQDRLEIVTTSNGAGLGADRTWTQRGEEHQNNRCPQPHRLESACD